MNTKAAKKKALLNGIMILSILIIAAAGILLVGRTKGWFDRENPASSEPGAWTVTEKSGSVNIYRGGLAYALKEENTLRDGDTVETLNRSALALRRGGDEVVLDENSRMDFALSETDTALTLENGEAFLHLRSGTTPTVNGETLSAKDAVVFASAAYGSGSVSVLGGEVKLTGQSLRSGEYASILSREQGGVTTGAVSVNACSEFALRCIRESKEELCITSAEVTALEEQRQAEKQSALEAAFLSGADEERIRELRAQKEANSRGGTVTETTDSGDDAPEVFASVCTVEIRCDTILENLSELTPGKEGYVPQNGIILAASKLSFEEGDTAFDVLKKACELAGIQLEYSWTPIYDSYYIEGINNLYEFDCGEQSGWMYKVNGWFPNYGCSSYQLEDGDVMVWCFTCKGLGADVGGQVW